MQRMKTEVAVAAVLLVAGLSIASATEPENLFTTVLEAFDARPIDCPASVESSLDKGQTVKCASLETRFSEFRKAWRRFMKNESDFEIVAVGDWSSSGRHWKRGHHTVDGVPLTVAFSESNSGLMLTYGVPTPMCENPTAEEQALPFAGTNGISMPKLAGGYKVSVGSIGDHRGSVAHVNVKLKIKIDRTGKPSVLCVLEVTPERYQLEDTVIASVEGNRYKPALLDGEPVDVAMTVEYDW